MKNFGSRKHKSYKCYSRRRDRLSELPDEVLVHILSFLPTIDAVRTLLLRRFGNLWTLVPTLEFNDFEFDKRGLVGVDFDDEQYLQLSWSRFSQFVHNVLNLYSRPTIDGFTLYISKEMDDSEADIQGWINLVLSKEPRALTLDLIGIMGLFSSLLTGIFISQSLVSLRLEHCKIEFPSGQGGVRVHMGSLRRLALCNVILEDDIFNELISGCPSLEEVFIRDPFQVLSLSTPSVRKLDLVDVEVDVDDGEETTWRIDCPNLKILSIDVPADTVEVNLPSVCEVTINSSFFDYDMDIHQFKRFLQGFQNAQVLTLNEEADVLLTYCSQAKVGFPHGQWKRVVLTSTVCDAWIGGICSFVRNSPCLEELIIHVRQWVRLQYPREVSEDLLSPCVAPHLRLVSMHGYGKPYKGQLRLAEFLLKSAINLEKLVIFRLTTKEELEFVKKLSNFPRSSAEARIVFE